MSDWPVAVAESPKASRPLVPGYDAWAPVAVRVAAARVMAAAVEMAVRRMVAPVVVGQVSTSAGESGLDPVSVGSPRGAGYVRSAAGSGARRPGARRCPTGGGSGPGPRGGT